MDKFRVIFNNLECAVEESGAETVLSFNRQEKIAQLRVLSKERSKSKPKQPKAVKDIKALKDVPSTNRILFRYAIERVGANGVLAEVFGRRCRDLKDYGDGEHKKEIILNDDEFWPFVFSKRWENYAGLRVCHGNVLNRLLVTLDRLTGAEDRLLSVSVTHYDTEDVGTANVILGSNPIESTVIPVRMEFTFYGRKVASTDEQLNARRKSREERPEDELPTTDDIPHLEQQSPADVLNTDVTDDEDKREVTDSALDNVGESTLDGEDTAAGEKTELSPVVFSDSGPAEDDAAKTRYPEEHAIVAQFATNALQETLDTVESQESQATDDASSLASTAEDDTGIQSQSTLTPTDLAAAASKELIDDKQKSGGPKRKKKKKKKKKKTKKKKKKKEDRDSKSEDEGMEMVYDSAVFNVTDDVTRNVESPVRRSTTADKKVVRRAKVEQQQTVTSTTVDDGIGLYDMFERRPKHARANFPGFEEYISARQKERKRERCRKKAHLKGAVLITDICAVSTVNLNATVEFEEADDVETKDAELLESSDDSLKIEIATQKVSLMKADFPESAKDRRITQAEQRQSLKRTEKRSVHSEAEQHGIGKENMTLKIDPVIKIETRQSQSKKDIQEPEKGKRDTQLAQRQSLKRTEEHSIRSQEQQHELRTVDTENKIHKNVPLIQIETEGTRQSQSRNEFLETPEIGKQHTQTRQSQSKKKFLEPQIGKQHAEADQRQSLKRTEKHSIQFEEQQNKRSTIDTEGNRMLKIDSKVIQREDEETRRHDGTEVQLTTKLIGDASSRDKNRRRAKEKMKTAKAARSVPTRVAIGPLGRSLTTWMVNDPAKWRAKPADTETKPPPKSQCDDVKAATSSDFALVTDFRTAGTDDGGSSNDDDMTDEYKEPSVQLLDPKRKESARKTQLQPKRSRTSSAAYARKSKVVLEQLRRSTKKSEVGLGKDRSAKLDEVNQLEAQQQQQQRQKNKKKAAVSKKARQPPTIKVEVLPRSQINEWDVDENFLRCLLLATDRFEVRKECIASASDRIQTMQFVTFTRPYKNTYC